MYLEFMFDVLDFALHCDHEHVIKIMETLHGAAKKFGKEKRTQEKCREPEAVNCHSGSMQHFLNEKKIMNLVRLLELLFTWCNFSATFRIILQRRGRRVTYHKKLESIEFVVDHR